MPNPERDISTAVIRKTIDEMQERQQRRPSSAEIPVLPCQDHTSRIVKLEATTEDHGRRLAAGDIGFAELRKDVGALVEKVGGLTNAAWWLIGVLIFGVLGTAGTALLWVISQIGKP